MKIVNSEDEVVQWILVTCQSAGVPIRFRRAFHQDVNNDDVFIVNTMCQPYRPDDVEGKIPITNLRTGKLSWVAAHRECVYVECSVVLGDGCER